MKRLKTMTHSSVFQSLFLAGLILASAGAQAAALPTVTIKGVIGNSLVGGPIAYDTSSWLGKAYTLELTADASNTVRTHTEMSDIPGEFENDWRPIKVDYRFAITGASVFSGTDNQYSSLETLNDVTVPAGLPDLPSRIVAGHTYDLFSIGASNIQLGCFSGGTNNVCDDESGDVYEGFGFLFDYFWDVAQHDGITDDNLPDLRNPALDFNKGFGEVVFNFWHFNKVTGGEGEVALLYASVTEVAVTPVPEAETYAMMLAGLGLVGWAARRRRTISK